jgi:twitching motility protein PilJ
MPFKFPALLPAGGGARRKADPDTAIVDDLAPQTQVGSLRARARFGDTVPGGPDGAGRPIARWRRALPLLGRLSLRGQVRVVFPLLGVSLALAFLFMWIGAREAATVAAQARLVGDSLMHSQRLAKAAPLALRGAPDGFRMLGESRTRLGEAIATLQPGGARLAEQWERIDQSAATLLRAQPTLASLAKSRRAVLDASPRLVELAEQVFAHKVASGAPPAEIEAAGQLVSQAYRIARDVSPPAPGDPSAGATDGRLGADATAFRELLTGLMAGSEARRLGPARDAELRANLVELRGAYAALAEPMGALLTDLPRLQPLRDAESRIAAECEPLRQSLLELQARLADGRGASAIPSWLVALFLLVSALLATILGIVHYQDLSRRAAEADAQRAEAERLEQEAKLANELNQAAILRLMNELQEVADGDLTIQATVSEDITGAIADSVNYTVEELRNLVARINITAELVAQASSKARTIASGLQVASEQQSREIRETGEAVLRMAAQINEVSASASESAQVARQSLGAAEQGRRAVHKAIAGMNGIRDQIQETAKRIKRLGESSQEIGEIVELISDITEQTNVLALNAAIQAASAGEAGRGFTVVAEEVQRLAERSAEATRQISALIRTIQADTQDAVAAMERSTQGVVAGTRLSDDAGNALAEIGRVSTQLAELIEDISRTTSDQASSAGTVAHSIQRILLVTEQTSEGTQQTAGSIVQLAELARELKNSVSRFRVG